MSSAADIKTFGDVLSDVWQAKFWVGGAGLLGLVAFLHSYILKIGFLDGAHGFRFAKSRMNYYRMIR